MTVIEAWLLGAASGCVFGVPLGANLVLCWTRRMLRRVQVESGSKVESGRGSQTRQPDVTPNGHQGYADRRKQKQDQ